MPPTQPQIEEAGGQRLPLGGVNRYLGIRGKQGRNKDKFQGVTPKKQHRTKLYDTPLEAAIAFAQMKEDLDLGMWEQRSRKKQTISPATTACSRRFEVGTYLGNLKPPPPVAVVPTVACALLLPQQAAAAAARGVAVAYADVAV